MSTYHNANIPPSCLKIFPSTSTQSELKSSIDDKRASVHILKRYIAKFRCSILIVSYILFFLKNIHDWTMVKRNHINIQFPSNQHFKFDSFLYISCSISSDNILKRCIEEVLWNSIHLSTTLKSDWWMIFNDRLINKGVVFYVLWTITS